MDANRLISDNWNYLLWRSAEDELKSVTPEERSCSVPGLILVIIQEDIIREWWYSNFSFSSTNVSLPNNPASSTCNL